LAGDRLDGTAVSRQYLGKLRDVVVVRVFVRQPNVNLVDKPRFQRLLLAVKGVCEFDAFAVLDGKKCLVVGRYESNIFAFMLNSLLT
jgi:hypothetical protein